MTHTFRFEQSHPTGDYAWECRCSCGWDADVYYRVDQYDSAADTYRLIHGAEVRRTTKDG